MSPSTPQFATSPQAEGFASPRGEHAAGAESALLAGDDDHAGVPGVSDNGHDANLVEETKRQIRSIVREIAQLCQRDISEAEFFDGFLTRVVSALAAEGGAIWTLSESGEPELAYQINLAAAGLTDTGETAARHARLLKRAAAEGEPLLAPPKSGGDSADEAGNPSDKLLLLALLRSDAGPYAVVEIFQRPGGGPTSQRGYIRFLSQMCDLGRGYLNSNRLRQFSDRQQLWQRLEQFIQAAHATLRPKSVAFAVANEGRRLIDCDRLSVLVARGGHLRVEAVSGQDEAERRSSVVMGQERLAGLVARAGEPLWFEAAGGDADADALPPPEIETALHDYLDTSHARKLAVIPLYAASSRPATAASQRGSKPVGAIVAETISEGAEHDFRRPRVEVAASHAGPALANALAHDNLFLLPLWRSRGRVWSAFRGRRLFKSLFWLGLVFAAVLALCVVPADFDIEAGGLMQPVVERRVYAEIDGVVTAVAAEHGKSFKRGAVLAELDNTELAVTLAQLQGQQRAAQSRVRTIRRALTEGNLRADEEIRLDGELLELQETLASLEERIALHQQQRKLLKVRAPIDGQVVTWRVRDQLMHRPVQKGQVLLSVVDPRSQWRLELRVPERRMGHINAAYRWAKEQGQPLRVTFMPATSPGAKFEGRVESIEMSADVRGEEGNSVLVRVAFDRKKVSELRPGSTVTAKIHCGRRAIGYVWFHEVVEFVRSKVLF